MLFYYHWLLKIDHWLMVSFKEIYNTFFQYVDIVKLPRKLPRIFKSWLCACCVFQPAFGCCAQPKAGRTTFFSRFQPFLFMSNLFQWFHGWNQVFQQAFGCAQHLKAGRKTQQTPLVSGTPFWTFFDISDLQRICLKTKIIILQFKFLRGNLDSVG